MNLQGSYRKLDIIKKRSNDFWLVVLEKKI